MPGSDHNMAVDVPDKPQEVEKSNPPKKRFDLEKLNDPSVMNAFRVTIGDIFATFAKIADEDAELNSTRR